MRRIAVIGGGVIGCSVAWHLADRGMGDILLVDRDRLGSGSTWHSAGNITWKPAGDKDAPVTYMLETLDRLERESGLSTGWLKTGRLFLARDAKAMEGLAHQAAEAKARGYESRLLEPNEAAARHPLLDPQAIEGAWLNSLSGRLDPAGLIAAYAKAGRQKGLRVREHCDVTGVTLSGNRVTRLETANGPIEVDDVVLCGGLWSRMLLEPLGVFLAQWGCEHFYIICEIEPRLARETPSFISPGELIYGREEVGGLLLGCFDKDAIPIDAKELPKPFAFTLLDDNWDKFFPYFEKAAEIFPALSDAPVRKFLNGPEAFTPDGNPLIGPVAGVEGLYVCTGMNSHGVTLSAAAGHMVADMLAGTEPRFDACIYAPERFGEKADEEDWLKGRVAHAPSSYYLQSTNRITAG